MALFSSIPCSPLARAGVHRRDRATANFDPSDIRASLSAPGCGSRAKRRTPLTDDEIHAISTRLTQYSRHPERCLALFYLMLTTGAKPLELARLLVKDVISRNGVIRREARIPVVAAINGVERPIFFKSVVAIGAVLAYARHRVAKGHGVGHSDQHAGLNPTTPLILDDEGHPYEIVRAPNDGHRYFCRGILVACRQIFRLSGIDGLCGSTIRRTLASRLSARGATIDQIGEAFGIKDRKAIRALLDNPPIDLSKLFDEIVCPKGSTPPKPADTERTSWTDNGSS